MTAFANYPLFVKLLKAVAVDNGSLLALPAELPPGLAPRLAAAEEDLAAAGDGADGVIEYLAEAGDDGEGGPLFAPAPRASDLLNSVFEGEFGDFFAPDLG